MYIYNVTLKVDPAVENDWLIWMKEEHIPDVMRCGLFTDNKVLLLTYSPFQDESEGNTFVVQYFFKDMEDYDLYQSTYAPHLQKKHAERYGEKVLAFRTILKDI